MYTLSEAAAAVGRSKTALAKAIKNGRISATRDNVGQWRIDPAELHRVYPPVRAPGGRKFASDGGEVSSGLQLLELELRLVREERDRLLREHEAMAREREALIRAVEEQAAALQAVKQLTDQRPPETAPEPDLPPPVPVGETLQKRPWWRWWK